MSSVVSARGTAQAVADALNGKTGQHNLQPAGLLVTDHC